MYISNLTPKERYRLTGTLDAEQIEELLGVEDKLESISGVDAHVKEAMTQYPEEDFLSGPIARLHELAKSVRGENRQKLLSIIEQLDDIAQCTFNAADYGRSELKEALKAFQQG